MKIPEPLDNEKISEYSVRLADFYVNRKELILRKQMGQFFTPQKVSEYMSGMLNIKGTKIRLLDPGAGTGILSTGFCEAITEVKDRAIELHIDLFEIDDDLIPILDKVMGFCQEQLAKYDHILTYNIHNDDFISFTQNQKEQIAKYDFVISNPPYFKLNKDDPQSKLMSRLVSGQPNIYSFFMAISADLLKSNGEMAIITPRSFCSGLYYKRFRKWFVTNNRISHIHIFESRKDIFDKDKILQENIIIKSIKKPVSKRKYEFKGNVLISTSHDKTFSNLESFNAKMKDLIYNKNGDTFIRIPSTLRDLQILQTIDKWPYTLKDLGLKISTGPVVPFRATKYLRHDNHKNCFPLLWMHNVNGIDVIWPVLKNGKEQYIELTEQSRAILLPVKNYVLLNRFSSKEQKRRLKSCVFLQRKFDYEFIGIENHINYISKINGNLTDDEALGLSTILNSRLVDIYFRALNGNTQVNATDIRSLPWPKDVNLKKIGKISKKQLKNGDYIPDKIIANFLDINKKIRAEIINP